MRKGARVLSGEGSARIEADPKYNDFYYATGVLRGVVSGTR
jgi:hypothetical protein